MPRKGIKDVFNLSASKTGKAYLEANDVDRLQKATTNLRDRLLIRLLSHLGCRISEALGIKVEDVDLVNYTITIQHLKARDLPPGNESRYNIVKGGE